MPLPPSSSSLPPGDGAPPSTTKPGTEKAETKVGTEPTFYEDILPIFERKCSSCHKAGSGLPNWSNYAEAFAKKDLIMKRDIILQDMPPMGSPDLSSEEIAKIREWIEEGAIASASPASPQQPEPEEIAAEPTVIRSQETVPKLALPKEYKELSCNKTTKYISGQVFSNRILSAVITERMQTSQFNIISMGFNESGRATIIELIPLFRSLKTGEKIKICGSTIIDISECAYKPVIVDSLNAQFDINCDSTTSRSHLNVTLRNGIATIVCETPSLKISTTYTQCRINQKNRN